MISPPQQSDTQRGIDEAALMGVALAAVLALFTAEGEWGWFDLAIGLTLVGTLAAYYRRPPVAPFPMRSGAMRSGGWREWADDWRRWWRAQWKGVAEIVAHAAVAGLSVVILTAWPFQLALHASNALARCEDLGQAVLAQARGELAWAEAQVPLSPRSTAAGQRTFAQELADDAEEACRGEETFDRQPWLWAGISVVILVHGLTRRPPATSSSGSR